MRRWPFSVLHKAIGQGDSDLMAPDFESFRRQELLFAVLNQILIGALLALQAFSRLVRGRPAGSVIGVLAGWLRGRVNTRRVATLPKGRAGSSSDPQGFHFLVARVQLGARALAHIADYPGRHCILRSDVAPGAGSDIQAWFWRHDRRSDAGEFHQFLGRIWFEIRRIHRGRSHVSDLHRNGNAGLAVGEQSSGARGQVRT
jgi:hypothetical protein